MRIVTTLLSLLCIVILVAMTIAPGQPDLRGAYASHLCPLLDKISADICAGVRRGAPADKPI